MEYLGLSGITMENILLSPYIVIHDIRPNLIYRQLIIIIIQQHSMQFDIISYIFQISYGVSWSLRYYDGKYSFQPLYSYPRY